VSDFLGWLDAAATSREARGLTRRLVTTDPAALLDLAGNDYLALRSHPRVLERAIGAVRDFGAGAGASRLVSGTLGIHAELESALAAHTRAPAALVLSTGYHANLAAITALTDADTLIVSDAHAHASLIDGCRLSRAQVEVARHNDVAHVRDLIATRTQSRVVLVLESIYSVLGDAAPLAQLLLLAEETGAVLVIDEAHAIGVAGEGGAGLVAGTPYAAHPQVVRTLTLSKALGSQGGAVLGHPAVRDQIVNAGRAFIFDTGLAPAAAGAALGALEVLAEEPDRPRLVRGASAQLAAACGVEAPAGAVMSVPMPGPTEALDAVASAAGHGIRIGCFRPPSTPDGISRLRITARADLVGEPLERALRVLKEVTA
jgi:8-amino-7-oxononanoate synthase